MRAREILKFSPIVTDAYFHYTPSQIMLAALSIADHDLYEHMIEATFPPIPSTDAEMSTPNGATGLPQEMAAIIGEHIKRKTVETVEACKTMLLLEPVERLKEFWGTVRVLSWHNSFPVLEYTLDWTLTTLRQADANEIIKPLTKKLRKCRDPDRFDLIALHKKRLEFREKEGGGVSGRAVEDDDVFGGGGAAQTKSDADREAKRRKVAAAQDPFGPAM